MLGADGFSVPVAQPLSRHYGQGPIETTHGFVAPAWRICLTRLRNTL